ncbi:MAG: phytanoyl-CoA dioxygenase family protein [Armatimonadota bacterium]
MEAATRSRLTSEQVEHFDKHGYSLFNQPVFEAAEFARLTAEFERCLEKYGAADLDTIHFREPVFLDFLMNDKVLDLVEPLIGPNIGIWSSHFICKEPRTGKATPWHEDSAYWNGRTSTMEGIVTVWLAIDRAFPENGSMGVVPGTHSGGFSEYQKVDGGTNIFETEVIGVDESKAVYFTLEPNECSLHEARIIHGAKANTSEFRRCGYTMRYFPTTTEVLPERNQGHKVWLARGKNLSKTKFENE